MSSLGDNPHAGRQGANGSADPPCEGPIIALDRVFFSSKDRKGKTIGILQDFSLRVAPGEFVAVVGPSGCGKSTALNFMAGLVKGHQSGTVRVRGVDVSGIAQGIGYMFQTHGLFPWRNIIDNVCLSLEVQGAPLEQRRSKASGLLAELGLAGFENHYPAEISGGMRQRVSLARTLATDPAILLMDEPFGALDAQTKLLVQDGFVAYWEKNQKTVVFVTHDLSEAIFLADRVVVMSARPGRVKAEYTVPFPRPRNLAEIRVSAEYGELWERIWLDLKDEARHSMQGGLHDQ
ncbi:ABC transporter ATP-binding protein [Castellaniella sp.]|uniref:ABC transporter ATP-binding protein n=1 Tax=Castellaniella sp. TaxID=1955812 RepID=UPI003C75F2D2